ncbi:hypothetical protein RJ639_034209 [Escallonia herrerae]|uniref:Uncharacterized protein n=1 Tax=Escallonia herrerae TaxID=1293975 RepID=A0AA89BEK9_9ASTE|nr:hypothetical protein RJ639_034209 [Escallonia herrerae]
MIVIRSAFTFMLGAISGACIAQSYQVPNIRKHYKRGCVMAKRVEETYREPEKQNHIYNEEAASTRGGAREQPREVVLGAHMAEGGALGAGGCHIDGRTPRHHDLSTKHGDRTSLDEVGSAAPPLSIEAPRLLPHPPPYLSPLHESTPLLATALETDTIR